MFETNNYYTGGASPDWFKYISPLIGVVVGFILSQVADWIRKRIKRKKLGKQYEYHLRVLKGALTVNIKEYSTYIDNYSKDIASHMGVASTREPLQVLKSLDILELYEYIKSQKGKTEANRIHQYMSTINFLDYETKRMDEEILKAVELMNEKGRELRRAFENIGMDIIRAAEVVKNQRGIDKYFDKVEQVATKAFVSTRPDENYWEVAEKAMNFIITVNGQHPNHEFAKKSDESFQAVVPKYKTLMAEREHAIKVMRQIIQSFDKCNNHLPLP